MIIGLGFLDFRRISCCGFSLYMCCYDGARLIAVLANSMSLWTDAIAYFFFGAILRCCCGIEQPPPQTTSKRLGLNERCLVFFRNRDKRGAPFIRKAPQHTLDIANEYANRELLSEKSQISGGRLE
jgi:hypothetical protein